MNKNSHSIQFSDHATQHPSLPPMLAFYHANTEILQQIKVGQEF